jgi:hypothetical protein
MHQSYNSGNVDAGLQNNLRINVWFALLDAYDKYQAADEITQAGYFEQTGGITLAMEYLESPAIEIHDDEKQRQSASVIIQQAQTVPARAGQVSGKR